MLGAPSPPSTAITKRRSNCSLNHTMESTRDNDFDVLLGMDILNRINQGREQRDVHLFILKKLFGRFWKKSKRGRAAIPAAAIQTKASRMPIKNGTSHF